MSELSKAYDPNQVESEWYATWLKNGCFKVSTDEKKEPFTILMPPPNVTGVLTMGHVLNNTIQDILIRRARQQGKNALWLPGTDHAGIATQTRVEKELKKTEGKTRHDLGRDAFIKKAIEWRDTHSGIIFKQLQRLGASCDWDRSVHTLDSDYSEAVLTAFVELFKRGYIYRGERMVNWCPVSHTALSDEEVIMKPQKSKLYKIRYEIAEKPGSCLEICTTRPETIMADTAIAVHPDDERFNKLIGLHVWRPLNKAKIPIIGDETVLTDFGTGALKVTPAHDQTDFEIGKRHNLPVINILNPDGTLNANAGKEFEGMDRFEARNLAAKLLDESRNLVEIKAYDNKVGFSERADVPIEPRISEQWFLKYPKIEEAIKVVQDRIIKFWPERWTKTYLHWLKNIQDWCISRQLWWGHRIPVWYRKNSDRNNPENWHVSVKGPDDPQNWEQDDDVLDTWFSSWLWPFATFGWPHQSPSEEKGLNYFYPTDDLVTGPDIIFFWVSRMIIAGLEFMGPEKNTIPDNELFDRIPFKNVYFTGIIRDLQGRKMSKSLGNSPDPIELIDKYGADGLRYGIMSIAPQGQDVLFSEERVHQGRNFCNKLWNACRFRQMSGDLYDNSSIETIISRIDTILLDADDYAVLDILIQTLNSVNQKLNVYEFNGALQDIYNFFWNSFCDWYVEVSKSKLQSKELQKNCLSIQDLCIRQLLLALHPFLPFITEELWHLLGYGNDNEFIQNIKCENGVELLNKLQSQNVIISQEAVIEISNIREFVSKARSLKAQFQLANSKNITFLFNSEEKEKNIINNHLSKLKSLIGAEEIQFTNETLDIPATITALGTLYIDLSKNIDIESEIKRLTKELEKYKKLVSINQAKLNNESFTAKAPPHIIEGAKVQLEETQNQYNETKKLLQALSKNI